MSENIENSEYPEIFFDTETTGKSHKYCGIVELGMIKRQNGEIIDKLYYKFRYNPEDKWEDEAEKVHQLTREQLKDEPLFEEEAEKIIKFISGCDLIAHNANFDADFLSKELKRAKYEDTYHYVHKVYDTIKMSKAARPGKKHSLNALCSEFEIDMGDRNTRHAALEDAELLIPVFDRLSSMTKGKMNNFIDDLPRSEIHFVDLKGISLPTFTLSKEDELEHQSIIKDIEEKEKIIPIEKSRNASNIVDNKIDNKKEEKKKYNMI